MAGLEEEKTTVSVLYDYTLVIFIHKGRKKKVEDIEIIPTNWLSVSNKKVFTSYMPGKIEGEDCQLLQDLIQNRADAPSDWPAFHVKIIGRAKDYEEAVAKSKSLEIQESVLTCDSDEEQEDVQSRMMTAIMRRDLLKLQAAMLEKVNIPASEPERKHKKSAADLKNPSTAIPTAKSNQLNTNESVPAILNIASSSNQQETSTYKESLSTMVDINLPVLDIQETFQYEAGFEKEVMYQLIQLNRNVSELLKRQEALEKFLLDKKIVNTTKGPVNLKAKYGIKIPFQTIDEFLEFDKNLAENMFLKQDVSTDLRSLVNADGVISKSYVNMMKKYFDKEVALKFTASRVSNTDSTKIVLKKTEFCKCMETAIKNKRKSNEKTTEERDLLSGLSDVLSNVKKWAVTAAT